MTTKNIAKLAVLCLLALPLGGCNGAFIGNFFVLFVSMGIFFGTLNLNRVTGTPRMPAKDRAPTESSS